MEYRILPKVEDQVKIYQGEHSGERPLFIVMPLDEADRLLHEVRVSRGYSEQTPVTEFDGMKIVRDIALKPGDIRFANELPETGS